MACGIGANHCRLQHVEWEKSGHRLASRPRETSSIPFLNQLLLLFRYPENSGVALLHGVLPSRYCTTGFAVRVPTWALFSVGLVADLIAEGEGVGPVHVALYTDVGSGADAACGGAGGLGLEDVEVAGRESDLPGNLPHILSILGVVGDRLTIAFG